MPDQTEIIHDGHAPRKARDVLQGIVRRANDGASVSQALIIGESIKAPGHAGFHSATDDAGRFQTERWLDRMFVLARDVQENQAGCVIINEDDVSCEVPVAPAATITGRVVDETGKPVSIRCARAMRHFALLPLLPDEDPEIATQLHAPPAGVYFLLLRRRQELPYQLGCRAPRQLYAWRGRLRLPGNRSKSNGAGIPGQISS